jgi:hypothetical protein
MFLRVIDRELAYAFQTQSNRLYRKHTFKSMTKKLPLSIAAAAYVSLGSRVFRDLSMRFLEPAAYWVQAYIRTASWSGSLLDATYLTFHRQIRVYVNPRSSMYHSKGRSSLSIWIGAHADTAGYDTVITAGRSTFLVYSPSAPPRIGCLPRLSVDHLLPVTVRIRTLGQTGLSRIVDG